MKDKYIKAENFVVKLRAYPNEEQKQKIDKILDGIRVAYNVTAYEISKGNTMVTKADKKDESVRWPNFALCLKKEWLDYLRENYEQVNCVPAQAMSSQAYGIFKVDMQKSWENFHPLTNKQARDKNGKPRFNKFGEPVYERSDKPVKLPCGKWKPEYYSNKKPRTSFTIQVNSKKFMFIDDSKSVKIPITNIGLIKTRGWRYDIRFGKNHDLTFTEAYGNNETAKAFGVTLSKDRCGDYWISVKLQTVWIPDKSKEEKSSLGIDVGIKDIAITSDGDKYENKHFAKAEKKHKRRLNRQMSRRMGWSNEVFRDAHKKDKTIEPSNGYKHAKLKHAKLERKIERRRRYYNHNVSADIVSKADYIGIESLNVSGMMNNRHLAFALADAAMYDVLSKIKYKADWHDIPVYTIGQWEPSSQLCRNCGYKNSKVKNLNVREWTCPNCGTHHDRDVNATRNILAMSKASGTKVGNKPKKAKKVK